MRINKHDTNGTKPLLGKGELGYDDHTAGGDTGRVYVGNGASNIALAKKSEVDAKVVANAGITAGTATKVTYDAKGLVTSGTNPTTLGGYGITDTYTKTETNTQISTAVNGLVDAAPGTLDTLNELAAALGDDPNFATTIANSIGTKVTKVTSTDNAIVRFDGTTGKVQNSSITVDDNGNIGSGTQSFNGFGGTGFKNYIINGNFDVWQYGISQTAAGYGSDDRWSNGNNISTKTHSQIYCSDTERALFSASNFSRTVSTYISGTNSLVKKAQYIEDMTRLAGKIVTISFWARADSNKKMNIQVIDFYGTGGAPSANGTAVVNFGIVNLTSSWTKYKLTGTLPSLIGKTLGTNGVQTSSFRLDFGFTFSPERIEVVNYGMPAGQSGTFDIAQVQLEEGSVATPFEQRPYGLELSLCQRYFRNLGLNTSGYSIGACGVNTGTVVDTTYGLPIPMRINPDLSVVGAYSNYRIADGVSAYTPTSIAIQDSATDSITIRSLYSGGTAGRSAKLMTITTNGGILLNAEL